MGVAIRPLFSMIESDFYYLRLVNSQINEGASLPYTVKVFFDTDNIFDPRAESRCERDFRKKLINEFGSDVGCYFDRYSMMATLSFRHPDDAARFILPLE